MVAAQDAEMGAPLRGHEEKIVAAGGRVVVAHCRIGVVVAKSRRSDFAARLGGLDKRLLSVRRRRLCHTLHCLPRYDESGEAGACCACRLTAVLNLPEHPE